MASTETNTLETKLDGGAAATEPLTFAQTEDED